MSEDKLGAHGAGQPIIRHINTSQCPIHQTISYRFRYQIDLSGRSHDFKIMQIMPFSKHQGFVHNIEKNNMETHHQPDLRFLKKEAHGIAKRTYKYMYQ